MAGEYGEQLERPHFHALLFGLEFSDRVPAYGVRSVCDVYRSPSLESLWPYGFSSIGEVTFASARYTAAYCVKKVTGPLAEDHYRRVDTATGEIVSVEPEFCRMSLKPGIGAKWFEKYWADVYKAGHGGVVLEGKVRRVPRYFKQIMEGIDSSTFYDVEFQRALKAMDSTDNSRERLAVREQVEIARHNFYKETRA